MSGGSVAAFDHLIAQIAARYDKYDDITAVDDAVSKMFGLEWRPFESLLLRASYATSFRAPDMNYIYKARGTGYYASTTDYYRCGQLGYDPANTTGCPYDALRVRHFGRRQ